MNRLNLLGKSFRALKVRKNLTGLCVYFIARGTTKNVHNVDIREIFDLKRLLPELRRYSRRETNFPFLLQSAYKFVQENIEVNAPNRG